MPLSTLPKAVRRALALAVLAAAVYFLLGGAKGIVGFYRLHRDVRALQAELHETQATVDSLQDEIKRLKDDTTYIERLAREKLGLARPNERVYKFVDKK